MNNPIIIFGIGKIAEVIYHHIIRDESFQVICFCCDKEYINKSEQPPLKFGLPVLPFEDIEHDYPPSTTDMLVAVGYQNLNQLRRDKCSEAKNKGYRLVSYISKKADFGDWFSIGENCVVLDSVGLQPQVKIGNNVFIWNNSLIGHHSIIEDDCWLAAGSTIGGGSIVGRCSFIGLNATINGEIKVGCENLIGAASFILKDSANKSVFISPASEKFRLDSTTFLRMTALPAMGKDRIKGA